MKLRITIEGVRYDVDVEVLDDGSGAVAPPSPPPAASAPPHPAAVPAALPAPAAAPAAPVPAAPAPPAGSGERVCKSPIAGTILDVRVVPGDHVALNQTILVMEAMKMESNVVSSVEGVVRAVLVAKGTTVRQGQVLVTFD